MAGGKDPDCRGGSPGRRAAGARTSWPTPAAASPCATPTRRCAPASSCRCRPRPASMPSRGGWAARMLAVAFNTSRAGRPLLIAGGRCAARGVGVEGCPGRRHGAGGGRRAAGADPAPRSAVVLVEGRGHFHPRVQGFAEGTIADARRWTQMGRGQERGHGLSGRGDAAGRERSLLGRPCVAARPTPRGVMNRQAAKPRAGRVARPGSLPPGCPAWSFAFALPPAMCLCASGERPPAHGSRITHHPLRILTHYASPDASRRPPSHLTAPYKCATIPTVKDLQGP